jgi:S-adenosylmethionine:tRNA ribosyltransferase-isomerase
VFIIRDAKIINFAPINLDSMQYISINDYDYNLPDEKIAKYPVLSRDDSKLLIFNNRKITDDIFSKLDQYLPSKSLLVYNDTRVIQARLLFQNISGSQVEIFCLEPLQHDDYYNAFQQKETCLWKCLIGNSRKWREENLKNEMQTDKNKIVIEVIKKEIHKDYNIIQFKWQPANYCFGEILEFFGQMPIPPYLHRQSEEVDVTRYQTIYSTQNGSVAAPTAGLHFTPSVFEKLEVKDIQCINLTLHVGAGTFLPVKENNAALHQMHSEPIIIRKKLIENLLNFNKNITATGTTSLRALESIYWIGVKLIEKIADPFYLDQWEAYALPGFYSLNLVFNTLLEYYNNTDAEEILARTKLMIIPEYEFKVVNRLITNFHQPKSTLLMLIAAFTGKENWKEIYTHALENHYRFLSYGDCSLLTR